MPAQCPMSRCTPFTAAHLSPTEETIAIRSGEEASQNRDSESRAWLKSNDLVLQMASVGKSNTRVQTRSENYGAGRLATKS